MKITITNPSRRPFWRGGMQHPPGEHTYPADHFGAAQLKAIEAEPHLTVTRNAAAEAKPAEAKPAKPTRKKAAAQS